MSRSRYEGEERTRVVKSTADLNRSQLAVKSHGPWRIGGNFAGIFLSTLTATIYKISNKVSTLECRWYGGRSVMVSFRPPRWVSLHSPELEEREDSTENKTKEKTCWNRKEGLTPLQQEGFGLCSAKTDFFKHTFMNKLEVWFILTCDKEK